MAELVNLIDSKQVPEIFFIEEIGINLTNIAIKQFLLISKEAESKEFIRIGIKRSVVVHGFQYLLNFIDKEEIDNDEDIIINTFGIKFVMDIFSKEYLKGTTIDFIQTLQDSRI